MSFFLNKNCIEGWSPGKRSGPWLTHGESGVPLQTCNQLYPTISGSIQFLGIPMNMIRFCHHICQLSCTSDCQPIKHIRIKNSIINKQYTNNLPDFLTPTDMVVCGVYVVCLSLILTYTQQDFFANKSYIFTKFICGEAWDANYMQVRLGTLLSQVSPHYHF